MKRVKTIFALLLALCLLAVPALAADNSGEFSANVSIVTAAEQITVTVADSPALAEYAPKLTVNCAFDEAYVVFNGELIASTLDMESGKITFTVTAGGTYTIQKEKPAPTPDEPAPDAPEDDKPVVPPYYPPVIPVTPSKPVEPEQPAEPEKPVVVIPTTLPYGDVAKGDWSYEGVGYATAAGLMNGISPTAFAPAATATRGMVWTILARLDGETVNATGADWYRDGQEWATMNRVSDGLHHGNAITRAELITMLWRYAGEPAVSASDREKLAKFVDVSQLSDWAVNAMAWAVSNGIIDGIDGALQPQSPTQRAQLATILMRFCEAVR